MQNVGRKHGANAGAGKMQSAKYLICWSEWQDLNLRPLRPERSALPG
jgi:hypothetical protein